MANEKRLIDANALIDSLEKWLSDTEVLGNAHIYNAIEDCLCEVDTMPTVDAVEVVHGEWLYGERNKAERTLIVECSECGATFNLPMFDFGMRYNYCPNCGAKMDGDGNG